jgi:hypothetical protein
MICHRCHADAVAGTVAQMPLCWTCIRQVKAKMPASFVGGPGDSQEAGFFDDVPGPYSLGKKIGENVKGTASEASGVSGSVEKATGAIKDITSTVKVLAITGACFGGAFLIYTMWRAHKMQERAVTFATEHPEIVKAALL